MLLLNNNNVEMCVLDEAQLFFKGLLQIDVYAILPTVYSKEMNADVERNGFGGQKTKNLYTQGDQRRKQLIEHVYAKASYISQL